MDKKPRNIIFGEPVRKAITTGVTTTYLAVATTLGSKGRNVSIEKNWGAPLIIHDGVTVAREVVLKDPFANMAAQQVIAAAQNTNNQAGDGTTTATILTYAIVTEGMKQIAAKVNPQVLRKGIEKASELVVKELRAMATPVKSFADMKQIASISAADEKIGELIATAIEKVGRHGVVTVQESSGSTIEVEYKEGMEFQKGLISPYLITDANRMEAVLEGSKDDVPFVVVVNQKLNQEDLATRILTPIMTFATTQRFTPKVIVIADDFDQDAFSTLLVNRIKGSKLFIGVKAPEFGEHRTNMLHDIALMTGATVLGGDGGIAMTSIELSHFGRADKVISNRDQTIIIGGKGDQAKLKEHIEGIKNLKNKSRTPGEKDKLEARLAKLVGGVAVISVGAHSEAEQRELKERVYDAVNATQAAIEEGIVPGGGVALLRASKALESPTDDWPQYKPKYSLGVDIVRDALYYPLTKLVDNAGSEDSGYVLKTILQSKDKNLGYNVDSEAFEDMVKSGIIDPVKVTVSAFLNAISAATMLLTTECMISLEREKPQPQATDMEGIGSFES